MSDYLINLGKNKVTQAPLKALGVSIPVELKRAKQPWQEKELEGKTVCLASPENSLLKKGVQDSIKALGANLVSNTSGENRVNALVFDATGIHTTDEVKQVYQFFHDNIRNIKPCSRLVVIAREASEQLELEAQVVHQGIEALAKSLAKEVGRKGSTAQVIAVDNSLLANAELAQKRLKPVLAFLLSDHPAFISGQVFRLSDQVATPGDYTLSQPLKGKIALVTGAARGIGEATARKLASEGATVVVLDRPEDEEQSQKVAREITGKVLSVDVSKDDAPQKIVTWIKENVGHVDIVVHNAGVTRDKTIAKMPEHYWDMVLNINLKAILKITEALLKEGLKDGGRIICLSSISGIAGNFGQTNYTMTKGGVIGFVKALAPQLALRGITVNAIAPGFIETRMTETMPFFTREGARRLSNLSQGGLPIDIAEAITFLSTPGAYGITGQVIRVCGGSLMGA